MNLKTGFFLAILSLASGFLTSCTMDEDNIPHPLREEYQMGSGTQTTAAGAGGQAVQNVGDINAIIRTSEGDIGIRLYASKVPMTVANFLNLAKRGYYDGLIFHRVVPEFVIQGGDPTGTGMGGPGYAFPDEFREDLKHNTAGILSMANSGRNTNGSQFFITQKETPHLDGKHSVFGIVTSGLEVVYKIKPGDKIKSIKILDSTDALFNKEKIYINQWNRYLNR